MTFGSVYCNHTDRSLNSNSLSVITVTALIAPQGHLQLQLDLTFDRSVCCIAVCVGCIFINLSHTMTSINLYNSYKNSVSLLANGNVTVQNLLSSIFQTQSAAGSV